MRHPVVLTTVEEDFRKIGLLPALTENKRQLDEVDDPAKPRDVPSPDPSTLPGLDTSGGDKSANSKNAKQPKPAMGPGDDDSDALDPTEDGGSKGAQKSKGKYHTVPHGKEASIKGESRSPAAAPRGGYQLSKKQPAMKGRGKNKGDAPRTAQGLKPAKRIAGMHKMEQRGPLAKTAKLIEEVEQLLHGVQIDEEYDAIMRGLSLVSEDAALLADRLTEISDKYEVDGLVSEMEELSKDAAETLAIVEAELENVGGDEGDEDAAINNSKAANYEDKDDPDGTKKKGDRDAEEPYDIPSPAFKEQTEQVYGVLVKQLMDALEAYDGALVEMGFSDAGAGGGGGSEVHHHYHGGAVHHHHHGEGGDGGGETDPDHDGDDDSSPEGDTDHDFAGADTDGEEPGFEAGADGDDSAGGEYADGDGEGDGDDGGMDAAGDDDGAEDDGGEGGEGGGLASRMAALRSKAEKLKGKKKPPFRGDEQDEAGY